MMMEKKLMYDDTGGEELMYNEDTRKLMYDETGGEELMYNDIHTCYTNRAKHSAI
jgi:hypothetical protein